MPLPRRGKKDLVGMARQSVPCNREYPSQTDRPANCLFLKDLQFFMQAGPEAVGRRSDGEFDRIFQRLPQGGGLAQIGPQAALKTYRMILNLRGTRQS